MNNAKSRTERAHTKIAGAKKVAGPDFGRFTISSSLAVAATAQLASGNPGIINGEPFSPPITHWFWNRIKHEKAKTSNQNPSRMARGVGMLSRTTPKPILKPREKSMKTKLAQSSFGRILLHLACAYYDHHYQWHWSGVLREFARQTAK
jgi:hypothetical protein